MEIRTHPDHGPAAEMNLSRKAFRGLENVGLTCIIIFIPFCMPTHVLIPDVTGSRSGKIPGNRLCLSYFFLTRSKKSPERTGSSEISSSF